ncbi:hypothetical protein LTR10_013109 [Elasticomyces elasticus]|uniref:SET domain-containing protein n=1 Tax=Exophiala sideris TaxID=1016849 RepID=A0ABR0JBG0_9EURO|nr:hypothetical protein LTR10_013109 [Elasticomyces elasticus]KAK5030484.1 hypothetical protein LTS07_005268 [Exophiala sideris]KAK5038538.1 hypothetical protein LTR13_004285 [Exophiala sideris]KAK5060419.1 hypothetical protein LTR69_005736 [Exophiala sideris]KAK5183331.1 hypothetical protein LTR44_004332 [Eurotiomycetes sp. CCFEE 6388]
MEPDATRLEGGVGASRSDSATPPLRMNGQAHSTTDIFDKHRRLVDWVLANDGYFHPHAQIAFSRRKGFHAVVADEQTLFAGARIASCPVPITMSVLNALDIEPFSSHGSSFPKSFLRNQAHKPESLQAFFLMEQLVIGEQSWWAPYIATLPTVDDVTDMQFEEEADVIWLEGTNLKGGISAQVAKWKEMYLQGMGQLKQAQWPNALDGSYTWPKFRWAATIFGSRSFTSQVLDDTPPADLARLRYRSNDDDSSDLVRLFSDRFGVLLPLLDLLNHKPGAKVEWQARYSFVGLQILENYQSGQELCNNYGPRDNEGLLLAYGFTIPDNPFDHLVISIRPPPGSPLATTRTWKQDLRSDPERRCFIFDYRHPQSKSATTLESSVFSFELLDSISVLCANEREMQIMFTRQQTIMSYCLGQESKFEDGRIILATLSQLLKECSNRASRLRATDPAQAHPPVTPANSKQRNAKVYRDSQLSIVETAVAVCKYVLTFAASESTHQTVLDEIRSTLSASVFQNLEHLLERHSKQLTHQSELLTVAAIMGMLPNDLSISLKKCLSEPETNLTILKEDAMSMGNLEKSRFAVILAALYSDYTYGVKLPHRVTQWLKQVAEWYPQDSESWAYVPTPGPWAPGEEPPDGLMTLLTARAAMSPTFPAESQVKRWLRPERLCWGWNVMEEEMVRVPSSILVREDIPDEMVLGDSSIVLYWQRY